MKSEYRLCMGTMIKLVLDQGRGLVFLNPVSSCATYK